MPRESGAMSSATIAQPSAIQVKGLYKSYGAGPVLHNLDLDVGWGERLVLFGGNGSGKTTLVKTLATLARPDAGQVQIAGWDCRRQGAMLRRSIGVVGHQPLLYEELTGYENLRFYGRMYRVPQLDERIQLLAEMVGVAQQLQARVRTLSHGMQKRLSLARALLHDPPVLLLDEPEAGLDQKALERLDDVLASKEGHPRAVLMTTHNVERGLALADRVAILARGRIAYQAEAKGLDVAAFRQTYNSYLGAAQ
ncbi:MAG: heme ABC exporter ATP-binding protein CcmA [Dehalococcoidia bacterium]|nr:heme ABC exporter ATP-binding protein CcmA [Dehalococcoidia bacterium]